jgi:hypothetical protein
MRQYDNEYYAFIEANLSAVLLEMSAQPEAADPEHRAGFEGEMFRVREWIEHHAEYGIAYEAMVATLDAGEFRLSGRAAIKLLEVGLLFGFKTERPKDSRFDARAQRNS